MVVFLPRSEPPSLLQVFSTVALTANLTSLFQHDFNVGSRAQFGDPDTIARIDYRSERTDFRNLSHLAIRQLLDAEDFKHEFLLIDEHTAQNHAIWWVVTSHDSQSIELDPPPVSYPGEAFVLWQSHIMIQVFLPQLVYCGDDQQQQVMYTADPEITRWKLSKWAVALTPEAAKLSGMSSDGWSPWAPGAQPGGRSYDRPPQPGDVVDLRVNYDWHSPRWPPPGVAGPFPGPTSNRSLAGRMGRHVRHPPVRFPTKCVGHKLRRPRPATPPVAIS
ncbi:MAG: hypothetical protein Q9186_004564 [Xanthomendoza sp. 1 TL-2023]